VSDTSRAASGERGTPRIVVTMGDPAGVGPEVILRALAARSGSNVSIVGSLSAVTKWAQMLALDVPCDVVDVGGAPVDPGRPSDEGAACALSSIETAARMCQAGEADAVVTAPVSKAAIADLGVEFTGHTEYLAGLTGASDYVMTFVHGSSRIGLVTTHLPLSEVAGSLSRELVTSKLRTLDAGLREWFGIESPRIAVAALNPHAGEARRLGDEEATVIAPAIAEARSEGIGAEGPFPADALFARIGCGSRSGEAWGGGFDAALAMYHDQGTIPAKLAAGGAGVNLTIGLPIVRASVDHGTAFDVAGRGSADPGSMAAAIELAEEIAWRSRES
jgi:4-hydroxythreonine-4-phosphate dehydrogenase